ncbi:hypothetical protein F4556_004071 [Kitasatospora gansuensis]|uniref:Uncharacterized protein n=1 Tax=Kitasatospora gansuensis TaxID=258050 RepID=A0A7W7SFV2_9ACTN|nr:hypothetical protein [Kitasatospora gansuensis]MBB4948536.1 hypothetical protein [Kitasatospora gansuensis]
MIADALGTAPVDTVVVWCGALTAVTAATGMLWRLGRVVRQIAHRVEEFSEDWQGTEPRPGVPGREGVMTRLDGIERRLSAVEHELRPNSGSSMRDAIDRVDRRTLRFSPDAEA